MKKRFIAIIMSALLAAVLCGCGDGDRDTSAAALTRKKKKYNR